MENQEAEKVAETSSESSVSRDSDAASSALSQVQQIFDEVEDGSGKTEPSQGGSPEEPP